MISSRLIHPPRLPRPPRGEDWLLGSPLDRSRLGNFDEILLLFALIAPKYVLCNEEVAQLTQQSKRVSWVDQVVTAEGHDAVLQIGKTLRASYAKVGRCRWALTKWRSSPLIAYFKRKLRRSAFAAKVSSLCRM